MEYLLDDLSIIPHDILQILKHEYTLAFYGVVLWQVEQYFAKKNFTFRKAFRNIGRSLVWVGAVVVFDDELLAQYNHIAQLDYAIAPWWMYIVAGFSIDILRSSFTKEPSEVVS
jgi:hypothetical protein